MTCACSSYVPCEKLMRATSSPASISARSTSGLAEAGPIVHTIFVRALITRRAPSTTRRERTAELFCLALQTGDQRVERLLEARQPLGEQLVGHACKWDSRRGKIGKFAFGGVDFGIDSLRRDAVVAKCLERRRRHRVHRVRSDQLL